MSHKRPRHSYAASDPGVGFPQARESKAARKALRQARREARAAQEGVETAKDGQDVTGREKDKQKRKKTSAHSLEVPRAEAAAAPVQQWAEIVHVAGMQSSEVVRASSKEEKQARKAAKRARDAEEVQLDEPGRTKPKKRSRQAEVEQEEENEARLPDSTTALVDTDATERAQRKAEKRARKEAARLSAATAAAEQEPAQQEQRKKEARKLDKGKGKATDLPPRPLLPTPSSSAAPLPASLLIANEDDLLSLFQRPAPRPRASTSTAGPVPDGELASDLEAFRQGSSKGAHHAVGANPSAGAKKGTPAKSGKKDKSARVVVSAQFGGLDPQDVLATQWLPVKALKAYAADNNFTYKMGKFSRAEDALLDSAIETYSASHALTPADLHSLIFPKSGPSPTPRPTSRETSEFWTFLTRAVELRPLLAVYNHIRRIKDPAYRAGKWTEEEDTALRSAKRELGDEWTKIAERVGRAAADCRDRWRAQWDGAGGAGAGGLAERDEDEDGDQDGASGSGAMRVTGVFRRGRWTNEEEQQLREAVRTLGTTWLAVAQKVPTRSFAQCRVKWASLSHTGTPTLAWSALYRPNLVRAVAKQSVESETDVDWARIDDPLLVPYGPVRLRERWGVLVREAAGEGAKDHRAHVAWLQEKFPPRKAKKVARKAKVEDESEEVVAGDKTGSSQKELVKSTEFVSDGDDEDEDQEVSDGEAEEEEEDTEEEEEGEE